MNDKHVAVGGDFIRIFDPKDYLAMINIPDEATCILRGHLILEEVLNLWSSKLTGTDDLYAGTFVPFKTKLVISKNLGMSDDLYKTLYKINEIRNRFSHRKEYELELSTIDALKIKVDKLIPSAKVQKCETFHLFVAGKDQNRNSTEMTYTWENSDNRIKFVIVFVILMLKLTSWMQDEFVKRDINYRIIAIDQSKLHSDNYGCNATGSRAKR